MIHADPKTKQSTSKAHSRLGRISRVAALLLACWIASSANLGAADEKLEMPVIFGDNMVFQRDQANPVWGWFTPGAKVAVNLDGETHEAAAGEDGRWEVTLKPREAGGPFTLSVEAGDESKTISNVMFGEVWLCSGQSNMNMPLLNTEAGEEAVKGAEDPRIRIIKVPRRPNQELQKDFPFPAKWEVCTPETAANLSGLAYYFAKNLSGKLDVPIGIIQVAAGGSAIEAWIERKVMDADPRFEPIMSEWREVESKDWNAEVEDAKYQAELVEWEAAVKAAEGSENAPPRRPSAPVNPLESRGRPGNFFGGMLSPAIGFGIRGILWYQGESNAGREAEYADLFPVLINSWREAWDNPKLPFFWVQLASFGPMKPVHDGSWAGIREAQSAALSLPHTGQVVTTDLGDADDIHPRRKKEVGDRLAMLALEKVYEAGEPVVAPTYKSHEFVDGKAIVQLEPAGAELELRATGEFTGFVIAGDDRVFRPAQVREVEQGVIEVWSEDVPNPVAVRYSWADNPPISVFSSSGWPLAPFRTDSWDQTTFQN